MENCTTSYGKDFQNSCESQGIRREIGEVKFSCQKSIKSTFATRDPPPIQEEPKKRICEFQEFISNPNYRTTHERKVLKV